MAESDREYLDQYDYVDEDYFYDALEEYAPLVGLFLMHFSRLERELNQAIAEYINSRAHDTGYIIVSQLNMGKKIEIFHKLFLQVILISRYKKRLLRLLNKIVQDLKALTSYRNIIAHADWGSLTTNNRVRIKIESETETGSVLFKTVLIKPTEIRIRIQQIEALIKDIFEFQETALDIKT